MSDVVVFDGHTSLLVKDQEAGGPDIVIDAPPPELPEIVFALPGPDTPGFLRRQRKALSFQQRMKATDDQGNVVIDLTVFDEMVEFFLDYVTLPRDRTAAREALLDASKAQYDGLLNAIQGGNADIPLANPTASAPGIEGNQPALPSKG